jgi:hypothetical protein
MSGAIETITADNGYVLEIFPDEDPMSPFEWEEFISIAFFHRRYSYSLNQGEGMREPQDYYDFIKDNPVISLPLFMLDHSGIRFSTGDFGDPWDSGQVGYVFVTLADVRKMFECKRITKKIRENIIAQLRAFVKTLDQYVSRDVYSYTILSPYGKCVDSCGGFYGIDEVMQEAQAVFEPYAAKQYTSYLKTVVMDMGQHIVQFHYVDPEGQQTFTQYDFEGPGNKRCMNILYRLEALGYKRSPYGNIMHCIMVHPEALD